MHCSKFDITKDWKLEKCESAKYAELNPAKYAIPHWEAHEIVDFQITNQISLLGRL